MSEENKNSGSDQPTPKKKKSNQDEFPLQEYRLVPVEEWEEDQEEVYEVDLLELANLIWENRPTIYKFTLAGIVLGLIIVLFGPKEYISDATLMPEYSTESIGGGASSLLEQYGGLIGLGAGTYNSSSNAIRVDLYPKIVESLTFQKTLADHEFYFPEYDTTVSIMNYYLEVNSPGIFEYIFDYTIGLPWKIMESGNKGISYLPEDGNYDKEIVSLSKEEMEVIEELRERVTANLNEESGIITVSAKMPNQRLAASVAKYTIEELTIYLTEYQTEKVLRDLKFIEEQLVKSKSRFEEAHLALAEFKDSNLGTLTAKAQIEEQRLNSEYQLAFNLYNELTQQHEQAKLKVQEETPIFKVLQPVQIPVEDQTNGASILIMFTLLSGLSSIGWIFLSGFLSFRNKKV